VKERLSTQGQRYFLFDVDDGIRAINVIKVGVLPCGVGGYAVIEGAPIPRWASGFLLLVAAAGILLLPSWERSEGKPWTRRMRGLGLLVLVLWVNQQAHAALLR